MPTTDHSQSVNKDTFFAFLNRYSQSGHYRVACSGGLDSCVLLNLFYLNRARIDKEVSVIYVNHSLHEQSQSWSKHCAAVCEDYGFNFISHDLISRPQRGESLEEWAREQRYAVFTSVMEQGDTLFTAHHLDDQAETFFLQALRGGGPRGLAAMSGFKPFGEGFHARPLLNYTRQQLEAYAKQHDLQWVEDPSNADINIERNYLRTEILPLIDKRWPAYRNTLDRLIAHQAETALLLDDIASQDLSRVLDIDNNGLLVDRLQSLSEARIKNLLLYWARQKQLDVPGSKHLYQIIQTALKSAAEACPCINWANTEIRRYKDRLYLQQQLPDHDPATVIEWDTHSRLQLNKETLTSEKTDNEGIDEQLLADGKVTIRFRQGGETIRPYNKSMTKTVKQLLQEKEVLPWYRDRLPLIYIDEKLAAIPGICIDENFVIRNKNRSRQIVWSGLNKSLLR